MCCKSLLLGHLKFYMSADEFFGKLYELVTGRGLYPSTGFQDIGERNDPVGRPSWRLPNCVARKGTIRT